MSFDQSTLSNTHVKYDSVDVYSLALILCRALHKIFWAFSISCWVPEFWWSGTSLDNRVSRFSELINTSTSGVFSPLLPDLESSFFPKQQQRNALKDRTFHSNLCWDWTFNLLVVFSVSDVSMLFLSQWCLSQLVWGNLLAKVLDAICFNLLLSSVSTSPRTLKPYTQFFSLLKASQW